jgi:Rap1a immunity proteins
MLAGCRDFVSISNRTADPKTINAFAAGNCAGQIEGLLILRDDLLPEIRFCKPPSVTTGQAIQMMVNWLEANPARWHENFVLLAHGVFKRAWPCKR